MRLGALLACVGSLILASSVVGSGSPAASSKPLGREAAALERVGVSWVRYAAAGNARKACHLQTEASVDGVPCDQLPSYAEVIYCPAPIGAPRARRWRTPAETVVKLRIVGGKGSVVIRSESRRSAFAARASFVKLGGSWRIATLRWAGHELSPPGLVFTEGEGARAKLWPVHC
jgi:hypothetical protein